MGFYLYFMTALFTFHIASSSRLLKMVHVVYRHGDRAAINTYPTDPNKPSIWPNGLAQLTQDGMRMEFNLGQFLRQRYMVDSTFMNSSYKRSEVYVRSSTTDRCLMSALSQLAGMYPPSGKQVWNKKIQWQPVPIHSVPTAEDAMFEMGHIACPALKSAYNKWHKSTAYVNLQKANQAFLRNISVESGLEIDTIDDIWKLSDTLFTEKFHHFPLPPWAELAYDRLINLASEMFVEKFAGNPTRSSLNAGVLLHDVVSHLKMLSKTQQDPLKKMYIYSGHDDNVLPFLASMSAVYAHQPPPYASAAIVELYQEDDQSLTIDLLYRNDSHHAPYHLPVKSCGQPCHLDDFLRITKDMVISDIHVRCEKAKEPFDEFVKNNAGWLLSALLLSVLLFIFLTYLCLRCRDKRRGHLRRWDLTDIDKTSDSQYLVQ